jgi:hypothetical protein
MKGEEFYGQLSVLSVSQEWLLSFELGT